MSKRIAIILVPLLLVAFLGCEQPAKTDGQTMGKHDGDACGKCDTSAKCEGCTKGGWCNKCQMVHGLTGTVHSDECNKDVPAGKYCAKSNRIMLPGTVKCCGKEVPKGSYCAHCKKYAGVEGVVYCEHCKKPCDAKAGCACCKQDKPTKS